MTTNFIEAGGKTAITSEIEYLNQEAREAVLIPGFKEGYEISYRTLDTFLSQFDRS